MKRLIIAAVLLVSTPAFAQDASVYSDEAKALDKSMETMHEHMMIAHTNNADVDFASGMIPHHQGAIDMAKIELQYGKDPEIRKLAQHIIDSQEKEIATMKTWLQSHPVKMPPSD